MAGPPNRPDAKLEPAAPELSVIAPLWNEVEVVTPFYERVKAALDQLGIDWELICVDDGSTDGTDALLRELSGRDPRVRVLKLSRNFGQQSAITAGLDFADGRAVVIIDADLQDPPEIIAAMLEKQREGFEVVRGVRTSREGETWFKRASAKVFTRLLRRVAEVDIVLDSGDFCLLDRRVVLELRRLRERHRFMRGLTSWVGFRHATVEFARDKRFGGTTKYPLRRLVRLSMSAITSFSFLPLQMASFLGVVLSMLSLLGVVVVLVLRFIVGVDFLVGQTTTLLAVLFLGGVQLLALGTIGEYVGRSYDEVRHRPLYIVSEALGFVASDGDGQPRR